MDTITITIFDPEVVSDLNAMESQKRIRIEKANGSVKKTGQRKSKSARRALYLSAPTMTDEERTRHKKIKQWMDRWR